MDIILLRTLSRKSILNFGKYSDCSVYHLISDYKILYLVWVYYNISGISFTNELLYEFGIYPHLRITKPGTSKIMYETYLKEIKLSKNSYTKAIIKRRNKGRNKGKLVNFDKRDKFIFNKGSLQRKNQGHK